VLPACFACWSLIWVLQPRAWAATGGGIVRTRARSAALLAPRVIALGAELESGGSLRLDAAKALRGQASLRKTRGTHAELMKSWMAGHYGKRRQRCLVPYGGKDAASGIPQAERIAMAGMFELFVDTESAFRFRLTAPDGTIMAVSRPFNSKTDAVTGIAAVREYAGMGLITDSCPKVNEIPQRGHDDLAVPADSTRAPKIDFHTRARAVRRAMSGPRWAGAIPNLS
jgi:uncharacterized protein YegP (UPF0339 family)